MQRSRTRLEQDRREVEGTLAEVEVQRKALAQQAVQLRQSEDALNVRREELGRMEVGLKSKQQVRSRVMKCTASRSVWQAAGATMVVVLGDGRPDWARPFTFPFLQLIIYVEIIFAVGVAPQLPGRASWAWLSLY